METIPRNAPTLDELRAHRDAILALAARYHASNVRVFGSVARGDATPDSDVDLLVNFSDQASLYDLAGLKRNLEALLNCTVDVVEDHAGMRQRFRGRIERDVMEL